MEPGPLGQAPSVCRTHVRSHWLARERSHWLARERRSLTKTTKRNFRFGWRATGHAWVARASAPRQPAASLPADLGKNRGIPPVTWVTGGNPERLNLK